MREVDIQPVEDKFVGTHCEVKIRRKLYEGVIAAFLCFYYLWLSIDSIFWENTLSMVVA